MFLEWVYNFENYGTDKPLATLKGRNRKDILQVFKCEDYYFSRPSASFAPHIQCYEISDEDILKLVGSHEEIDPKKALTLACRSIKQDFQKQANVILNLFS